MVIITFPDAETRKEALEFLLGRFAATILKSGEVITPEDFALQPMDLSQDASDGYGLPFHQAMEHHKLQIIKRALAQAGGSQTGAAELLGLQRTYLARLMKQMDLK